MPKNHHTAHAKEAMEALSYMKKKHKYYHNGTEVAIKYPGLGVCTGVVKKRFQDGNHNRRGMYYHVVWKADANGSLGRKTSPLYLYPGGSNPKSILAMAAVEDPGDDFEGAFC